VLKERGQAERISVARCNDRLSSFLMQRNQLLDHAVIDKWIANGARRSHRHLLPAIRRGGA
jgi:hypothetical protein